MVSALSAVETGLTSRTGNNTTACHLAPSTTLISFLSLKASSSLNRCVSERPNVLLDRSILTYSTPQVVFTSVYLTHQAPSVLPPNTPP